ncbi:uncharacterized protein LOC128237299 [Mya arenaria]|uniref:uncharacterized protein LOC128237299 n=1 Tax=Mya arenaria TaxID=6604 RepID=UPI0022E2D98B|nr:uncharacterized protein LOC128237299 [Mya arenaria]
MKKLRQKDTEIRKTKQKYETFELGKFNKLISENRRYVPDYDALEKVRQALRVGPHLNQTLIKTWTVLPVSQRMIRNQTPMTLQELVQYQTEVTRLTFNRK